MFLLRTKPLATQLSTQQLTEKETAKYLFAMFVIEILWAVGHRGTEPYSVWNSISLLFGILITVTMFVTCFRLNSAYDNRDFVKRFICLSLPVTIRLACIIYTIAFLVNLFDSNILSSWVDSEKIHLSIAAGGLLDDPSLLVPF